MGRPVIKVKESAARVENIPSTVVIHKHVYGMDTIFYTITGPLANNTLGELLVVIKRGTYQAAAEDSR